MKIRKENEQEKLVCSKFPIKYVRRQKGDNNE